MNLVPVDTAAAVPGAVEAEAEPGADFAALMTGLMAGDTQISPVLDLPPPEDSPEGAGETKVLSEPGSILEFIGTPPSGITINRPNVPTVPAGHDTGNADVVVAELTSGAPKLLSAAPALSTVASPTVDSSDAEAPPAVEADISLASVHPISSGTGAATAAALEPAAAPPDPAAGPVQRVALNGDEPLEAVPASETPPPDRTENRAGSPSVNHQPPQVAMAAAQTNEVATGSEAARVDGTAAEILEPATSDGGPEVDAGSWLRSIDTPRNPVKTSQGPAMVGIARRVEEAIAALATKPDPKVVTLQLDELDGIRLTVALRADGIHLSSNGDSSLTGEIERALSSRGFDMASDRQRDGSRDEADQATDDGWKPQTGHQRRGPSPSGITL